MDFVKIATEIAELVKSKSTAYGDSFGKSGEVFKLLYPDGIKPEQYQDALAVVRVVDKLFRIATAKDAFGESPWNDIVGYGLNAVARQPQSKPVEEKKLYKIWVECLKKTPYLIPPGYLTDFDPNTYVFEFSSFDERQASMLTAEQLTEVKRLYGPAYKFTATPVL